MVISRHISGKFRKYRYIVESILLLIYLSIPWISYNGTPLMRLNIPNREFYLLGGVFIPQEGYFLHLFLLSMGLSLFFFTSLIGRVWCGWACPQTVFTDLFDFIGRAVLGKKYGKKDISIFDKILLYSVWIIVSFISAFNIVAYFNDPYHMLESFIKFDLTTELFPSFIAFFGVALFLDMTFVREQFCRFACPYARFQTVLMDAHSYNVTYDHKRGEPRRNKTVKIGDCTACNMCLVVCPTGIDIREGLNIGCIACAKCVDACTVQMGKENKKSLINYDTLARVENNSPIKWIRPRTLLYATLLTVVVTTAVILLFNRVPLYASISPERNIEPMIIENHQVRNFYSVHLKNMTYDDRELKLSLEDNSLVHPVLRIGTEESIVKVAKNGDVRLRVFIDSANVAKKDKASGTVMINLQIQDVNNPKYKLTKKLPLRLPDDPSLN